MAPWLSAIAAALALIATTTTLGISLVDRRRSQASQVSVHLNVRPSKPPMPTLSVTFYNLSSLPVADVELRLVWKDVPVGEPASLLSLPPQNANLEQPRIDQWINRALPALVEQGVKRADEVGISLTFTDAAGRRWRRDHLGRLKAVRGKRNRKLPN